MTTTTSVKTIMFHGMVWLHEMKQNVLQCLSVSIFIGLFTMAPAIFWSIWFLFIYKTLSLCNELVLSVSLELSSNKSASVWDCTPFVLQDTQIQTRFGQFLILFVIIFSYHLYWMKSLNVRNGQLFNSRSILRRLCVFKHIKNYFPINLITSEIMNGNENNKPKIDRNENGEDKCFEISHGLLDSNQNYLLVYHPHGIFALGALINFGTECNHFSKRFPGIIPWIVTLKINFLIPFYREYLRLLNVIPCTYEAIFGILNGKTSRKTGNMIVIVLGGAFEALDSKPGTYMLHTSKRYGMFKLALMTGTHLIPCISLGETNMYNQVSNPNGSLLRRFQNTFTKLMTFSTPLVYARGLLPYRKPITTIMGKPIPCEKNENPSRSQVAALRSQYFGELEKLFKKYQPIYDPTSKELVYI